MVFKKPFLIVISAIFSNIMFELSYHVCSIHYTHIINIIVFKLNQETGYHQLIHTNQLCNMILSMPFHQLNWTSFIFTVRLSKEAPQQYEKIGNTK